MLVLESVVHLLVLNVGFTLLLDVTLVRLRNSKSSPLSLHAWQHGCGADKLYRLGIGLIGEAGVVEIDGVESESFHTL